MWRDIRQPVHVVGPYVILKGYDGMPHGADGVTVIDSRTGAITMIDATVVAAGGGTIVTEAPQNRVGLVRIADLPPLTC